MNARTVSMVSSATTTETRDASSAKIIVAIRSGKWRSAVDAIREKFARVLKETGDRTAAKKAVDAEKKKLPAAMWSGRFSRRANEGLIDHSGLLCADVDGLGESLPQVCSKLRASPHLWALFLSPTGDGLKAVFRITADPARHTAARNGGQP